MNDHKGFLFSIGRGSMLLKYDGLAFRLSPETLTTNEGNQNSPFFHLNMRFACSIYMVSFQAIIIISMIQI